MAGLVAALAAAILLVACESYCVAEELAPKLRTNGDAVRRVFADVALNARKWTVSLQSDGEDVALGVIVESNGLILSKASELEAGQLKCLFHNGRTLPAERAAVDKKHDLVLLKVAADGLQAIEWDTGAMEAAVGQWVIVPGHDDLPLAVGVVSAERREIPAEKTPASLGVSLRIRNGQFVIHSVQDSSGAEKAGLQPGDIIRGIGDRQLSLEYPLVTQAIAGLHAGDSVDVAVHRNGRSLTLPTRLDRREKSSSRPGKVRTPQLSNRRTAFAAVVQHDAVITPKDCGGSLLNLSGKAFAINIARAGRNATYAIPADVVNKAIEGMKRPMVAATRASRLNP